MSVCTGRGCRHPAHGPRPISRYAHLLPPDDLHGTPEAGPTPIERARETLRIGVLAEEALGSTVAGRPIGDVFRPERIGPPDKRDERRALTELVRRGAVSW